MGQPTRSSTASPCLPIEPHPCPILASHVTRQQEPTGLEFPGLDPSFLTSTLLLLPVSLLGMPSPPCPLLYQVNADSLFKCPFSKQLFLPLRLKRELWLLRVLVIYCIQCRYQLLCPPLPWDPHNLSATDILGWMSLPWGMSCDYRMSSSLPGLYTLEASSTLSQL